MAIDTTSRRTRRAILLGALGGVVASAAATVAGAQRVLAAGDDGAVIHVGDSYSDISLTTNLHITDTTSIDPTLRIAHSGVSVALTAEAKRVAVAGHSFAANGVVGSSEWSTASGVYGVNHNKGYGVSGRSSAGPLVHGSTGSGVMGENTANGVGVWARSAHGVALLADPYDTGAIAFRAKGVAQFARSGTLTIKAGALAVTKTGIRVDPGTLVLAVLQQDRPGVSVRSAVPDAAGNQFTIRLNKTVPHDTRVGWFLVN